MNSRCIISAIKKIRDYSFFNEAYSYQPVIYVYSESHITVIIQKPSSPLTPSGCFLSSVNFVPLHTPARVIHL